jgi:DNA-binding SARP family transcriptional activator
MASTISVRCFGPFELTIDGRPVRRWQAGKARTLLQLMLLRQGEFLSRKTLYESLWPDAARPGESSSLKVAVHVLRRILAASGASAEAGSSIRLLTHQSGYMLEAHNVWVDFQVFDQLVNQARTAQRSGRTEKAIDLFRKSVELYRGNFLPDVRMDWADLRREWLRSRALYAMERLVEADIANDDYLAVIDLCHRMLEIEPWREETYRALITAHGRFGQLSQVDRWYQLCVARLRDELQITPSAATQRLYHQARRGGLLTHPLSVTG